MGDSFIVPLKGEPYTAPPLAPEVYGYQRMRNWIDNMLIEHFIEFGWPRFAWPRLWLPLDTTEADIARMEGEGGVPC